MMIMMMMMMMRRRRMMMLDEVIGEEISELGCRSIVIVRVSE